MHLPQLLDDSITIANFPRYKASLPSSIFSSDFNSCDAPVPQVRTQIVTPYRVFCPKRRNMEYMMSEKSRIAYQYLRQLTAS